MPLTVNVTLPKQRKAPIDNLSRHTLLFGGEKGIGKTSFVTQWPDHFMLECEPGNASHLSANYEDIFSYDQAIAYVDLVMANPGYCKVLIVDEIQALYDYCCAKVREQQRLDLDEKFGYVEWGIARNYFSDLMLKFQKIQSQFGVGIVFTCHVEIKEIETRTGKKIARLEPQLTGQCNKALEKFTKFCGIILSASDTSRYMQIEGNDFVLAYNKFPDHFMYQGIKLKEIALGTSPEVAFANFNAAYDNTYVPQTIPTGKAPQQQNSKAPVKFNFSNKKGE